MPLQIPSGGTKGRRECAWSVALDAAGSFRKAAAIPDPAVCVGAVSLALLVLAITWHKLDSLLT